MIGLIQPSPSLAPGPLPSSTSITSRANDATHGLTRGGATDVGEDVREEVEDSVEKKEDSGEEE